MADGVLPDQLTGYPRRATGFQRPPRDSSGTSRPRRCHRRRQRRRFPARRIAHAADQAVPR